VDRPTLKKPKIGNFGRTPLGAKIFFRNSVVKSSSGVKMKEIEDVYFFELYGNGQLSRDMCFNIAELAAPQISSKNRQQRRVTKLVF
jgi:hypothetical protein